MQNTLQNKRDVAVQCLEALLARPGCRRAVWAVPGIIAGYFSLTSAPTTVSSSMACPFRFVEILKHSPGPQMSYQVAFCLWLLSFEQDVAEQINKCVFHTFSDLS